MAKENEKKKTEQADTSPSEPARKKSWVNQNAALVYGLIAFGAIALLTLLMRLAG